MEKIDYVAAVKLANKARNSIGKYCMEECNSLCCREGTINLTNKEMKLITGDKAYDPNPIYISPKKEIQLNLKIGCPCFIDNKCSIHNKRNRPNICKEFPLFIKQNKIILSHDCPAVQENKLYPYLCKFKQMGFIIV